MTGTIERAEEQAETPAPSSSLRTVLLSIIVIAALVVAAGAGYLWGSNGKSSTPAAVPTANSVDGGFARDMATHHQQAVTMATYARDHATNPLVRNIAYDIESSQSVEMGQMIGWLEQWHISRNSNTPMKWMKGHHFNIGPNGLMPGMATPSQMNTLLHSHGQALNILFLKLMIHHHQGGVEMAQYAMQHARYDFVRNLASHMYTNQSNEIVQMEQLLRTLGGAPLPPPQD